MKYPFTGIPRTIYQKVKQVIGEKRVWGLFEYFTKLSNFVNLCMFYCRNFLSHEECYITCSGKQDGVGAQTLAAMSTILFAERMHIKYVHTPFAKLQHNCDNDDNWEKKWEMFFNLGKDEIKADSIRLKITREISLGESPFKIKKKTESLFKVRHCHDYANLFPNHYLEIKDRIIDKYYSNSKEKYKLNRVLKKVNIAVHIRRGDVNRNNQFRDKFTENCYIVEILGKIQDLMLFHGLDSSICVYSEGNKNDFKELEILKPKFFLNTDPFTTFHNLVSADILLLSKSTFSYSAALLSKGIVFYEPFMLRPLKSWIKLNQKAGFNRKALHNKIKEYYLQR